MYIYNDNPLNWIFKVFLLKLKFLKIILIFIKPVQLIHVGIPVYESLYHEGEDFSMSKNLRGGGVKVIK